MAEEKKEERRLNQVEVTGYLREDNLEKVTVKGDNVIRGSIIIATDKINSHKIQFYVSETGFNGLPNKAYEDLEALLPKNVVTIASYLKDNKDADFDEAIKAASRVWTMGHFDEYARRDGEREDSYITVKGYKAGFSKQSEDKFKPKAAFSVTAYIGNLTPELDENENETGRLIISTYVPKYKGAYDVIDFVSVLENNTSDFIKKTYSAGDTVNLLGELANLSYRVEKEEKTESEYFGVEPTVEYETKFIRERRVTGGSVKPFTKDDARYISSEDVKTGLALREQKMVENGKRAKEKAKNSETSETSKTPAASASVATPKVEKVDAVEIDDMDF